MCSNLRFDNFKSMCTISILTLLSIRFDEYFPNAQSWNVSTVRRYYKTLLNSTWKLYFNFHRLKFPRLSRPWKLRHELTRNLRIALEFQQQQQGKDPPRNITRLYSAWKYLAHLVIAVLPSYARRVRTCECNCTVFYGNQEGCRGMHARIKAGDRHPTFSIQRTCVIALKSAHRKILPAIEWNRR